MKQYTHAQLRKCRFINEIKVQFVDNHEYAVSIMLNATKNVRVDGKLCW